MELLIATGVGIPLFWVSGGRCPATIPRRVSYGATGDGILYYRVVEVVVVERCCNCSDELLRIWVLGVSQPESKSGHTRRSFSGTHQGSMLESSVEHETVDS